MSLLMSTAKNGKCSTQELPDHFVPFDLAKAISKHTVCDPWNPSERYVFDSVSGDGAKTRLRFRNERRVFLASLSGYAMEMDVQLVMEAR
jgi:hypothetical protein